MADKKATRSPNRIPKCAHASNYRRTDTHNMQILRRDMIKRCTFSISPPEEITNEHHLDDLMCVCNGAAGQSRISGARSDSAAKWFPLQLGNTLNSHIRLCPKNCKAVASGKTFQTFYSAKCSGGDVCKCGCRLLQYCRK